MLKARLADTKPSNWRIADGETASETDGIVEELDPSSKPVSHAASAICA